MERKPNDAKVDEDEMEEDIWFWGEPPELPEEVRNDEKLVKLNEKITKEKNWCAQLVHEARVSLSRCNRPPLPSLHACSACSGFAELFRLNVCGRCNCPECLKKVHKALDAIELVANLSPFSLTMWMDWVIVVLKKHEKKHEN